eukprot:CAMPEP_0179034004 /NCGR_PEP_ID=MMETSP0796-20121207/12389_1 /TAXON_ID=73915 /ORGANISM="Pyrodinium bahamense, Strain pbaha01" /LENGTH=127 /DNA_ID=CAMNT_0020730267 /DNA_START=149 /DNA_END=532 /DNA_ORIENTATION=-
MSNDVRPLSAVLRLAWVTWERNCRVPLRLREAPQLQELDVGKTMRAANRSDRLRQASVPIQLVVSRQHPFDHKGSQEPVRSGSPATAAQEERYGVSRSASDARPKGRGGTVDGRDPMPLEQRVVDLV